MAENKHTFEISADDERILFCHWLNGEDTEDMATLPRSLFQRPQLYDAIKSGKTIEELYAEKTLNKADMVDIASADAFYYFTSRKAAYKCLVDQLQMQLSQAKVDDIEELQNKLTDALSLYNANVVEETPNLSRVFLDEMDYRKNEAPAKYGFVDLDRATGGIHRKRLIALGARPKTGKSALALQIADNVRKTGRKVLFFPLEMSAEETAERYVISKDIITQEIANNGELTAEQYQNAVAAINELTAKGLFKIYEGVNRLEDIEQAIRQEKPYLVVIDQLTQVRTRAKYGSIRERYVDITARLKHIALTENVAILLCCQLNRNAAGGKASLEMLNESDSIGQDADIVLELTTEDDQKAMKIRNVDLHIVAQRNGESGAPIGLQFHAPQYTFKSRTYDRFESAIRSGYADIK